VEVTGHEVEVTGHEVEVTGHDVEVTGHEVEVTAVVSYSMRTKNDGMSDRWRAERWELGGDFPAGSPLSAGR